MLRQSLAAVLAALTLGACEQEAAIAQPEPQPEETEQASGLAGIASVVDGDTIEIHGTRIRLSGYDTPERGARCGDTNVYQRAANELSDFIANRTVACVPTGTDEHQRTVATCSVNGTDLGDYMVSQGWGRDWPRYSHGAYAEEEASARSASRGLWGLSCPADLWGNRNYSQ
jgi:endonuclease YncB( thermonuclease family)